MLAFVQDRYGSPDVLELREVDTPTPGEGEVLVRVRAASVNARDWHFMRGDPYFARLAIGLNRPKEPVRGTDFAGTVEAVGAGVTDVKPGDEVYGEHEGAFAEYVAAPQAVVAAKPADLTFEQAAAMPLAANTALVGLRDAGQVAAGQKVLINGASGGVGTFAVQLAKAFGAEVTAVCSARNAELVGSLGADRVIDYAKEDFAAEDIHYDVLLDLVGNRSLADFRRAVTPKGALLLSGGGLSEGGSMFGPLGLMMRGQLVGLFVGQRVVRFDAKPSAANLATLRELAEAGSFTPVIDRAYPFSEIPEAIRYMEVEHARAKVVITV